MERRRLAERPASVWPSFLWLTLFQVLACLQLIVAEGTEASAALPLTFLGLTAVMWIYYAVPRATKCVGFEMETIAFFLSTLSLSITASSAPNSLPKQFIAVVLGLGLFLFLGLSLRDLGRVQKLRWSRRRGDRPLGITLVLGSRVFGAKTGLSWDRYPFSPLKLRKSVIFLQGPPPWSDYFADGT